jgi:opacity protein-like surface antigen
MMSKLLCLILTVIFVAASSSLATQLGIAGYGGLNIPVAQEDQGTGSAFGFRGKIGLLRGVVLEPNINFARFGDAEFDIPDITMPGAKTVSYGVDALLGGGMGESGLKMFGILGLGFYSIDREYGEDVTKFGWATGAGFEIGLNPKFGFDIRGKLDVISSEGGGSKKSAAVTGGLNFYFGY